MDRVELAHCLCESDDEATDATPQATRAKTIADMQTANLVDRDKASAFLAKAAADMQAAKPPLLLKEQIVRAKATMLEMTENEKRMNLNFLIFAIKMQFEQEYKGTADMGALFYDKVDNSLKDFVVTLARSIVKATEAQKKQGG